MIGIFRKKSNYEKLEARYNKLLKLSFELSKSNRAESDRLYAEAQEILNQMDKLES